MRARIGSAVAGALLALAVSVAAFGAAPEAMATQGQAIIAGATNGEDSATGFCQGGPVGTCGTTADPTGVFAMSLATGGRGLLAIGAAAGAVGESNCVAPSALGVGVLGCGSTAIYGKGGGDGVYASGSENGVEAHGGTFGVFATGSDYGVYASAPNHAVYGQATSSAGAGVEAASSSTSGTALKVTGKAKFSRSGITTISAGTSSKTISLAGVTTASMVLATAQQLTTVFVKAVVPASGSFSIRLTGNAPTGGLKVAYFVLN